MKANANAKWQSDRFLKTINALLQLSHLLKIGRILLVSIKKIKANANIFLQCLLLLNVNIKLNLLRIHFVAMSL